MNVYGNEVVVDGKFARIARFKEEWWDVDVEHPDDVIQTIRKSNLRADIFTFVQRIPESKPKYEYYMEWDNVAAIPVSTYSHWYKNQLHQNPRNKMKIAQKKGVSVQICEFDETFIKGMISIYHETPVRQGKPFPHFKLNSDAIRRGQSTFLDRAVFIGAFFNNELIGFLKLVNSGTRLMRTMGILTLTAHRDKAPMNLLIAKAVEICADKQIPYFVYGKYVYDKRGSDTLQDFKRYLGFESVELPRYFIPLNARGKRTLMCRLHNGVIGILPKASVKSLLRLRAKWHKLKYAE